MTSSEPFIYSLALCALVSVCVCLKLKCLHASNVFKKPLTSHPFTESMCFSVCDSACLKRQFHIHLLSLMSRTFSVHDQACHLYVRDRESVLLLNPSAPQPRSILSPLMGTRISISIFFVTLIRHLLVVSIQREVRDMSARQWCRCVCVALQVEEVKKHSHCLAFSSAGPQSQTYYVSFDSFTEHLRWHRHAAKVPWAQRVRVGEKVKTTEHVKESYEISFSPPNSIFFHFNLLDFLI